MIKFEITNKTLRIICNHGTPIDVPFQWPIAEVVQFGDLCVVRTQRIIGACDNQNVCAVDQNGRRVWIVTPRKHVYDDSPYTRIMSDGGMLRLFNWDGLNVVVDTASWREVSAEYRK